MLDAAQRPCGLLGTVERRIGGRREAAGLTTPEAPDLQRALRSMIEAGDRGLCDGSVVDRGRAAAARRRPSSPQSASRTSRRTTSTSTATSRSTSPPRPRSSTAAARAPSTPTTPAVGRLDAELRFGVESPSADVRCRGLRAARRPHGAASCARRRAPLSLEPRLRGRFNVDNVLCAVTLALLLEVPAAEPSSAPWR